MGETSVTVSVVRCYGSASRLAKEPTTVTLPDYPKAGERIVVSFGGMHTNGSRAQQIGRAIGIVQLSTRAGDPRADPSGFDGNVRSRLDAMSTDSEAAGCYTNIELAGEVTIASDKLNDSQYLWIDADVAIEQERKARERAAPYLDVICANTAVTVSPRLFETLVMDDAVVFSAPGKEPFQLPQFEVRAPTVSITMKGGLLDDAMLELRLESLAQHPPKTVTELGTVSQWYLAFLRESDSMKKFLFGFATLEAVTDRWATQLAPRAIEQLGIIRDGKLLDTATDFFGEYVKAKGDGDISIRQRFGIVALALFPEDAPTDLSDFAKAASARNEIAHGRKMPTDKPPIEIVQRLSEKYVRAALDLKLLAGDGG